MSGFGTGTELIGQGIASFGTAAGDIFTSEGDTQAAAEFGQAQTLAEQNALESKSAGQLRQIQTARQVSLVQGNVAAAAAAGGMKLGGGAADIMRANATQGALAGQLIGEQTQINVNSYMTQAAADTAEQDQALAAAKTAKSAAFGADIGGAFDILGGFASIAGAAASAGG